MPVCLHLLQLILLELPSLELEKHLPQGSHHEGISNLFSIVQCFLFNCRIRLAFAFFLGKDVKPETISIRSFSFSIMLLLIIKTCAIPTHSSRKMLFICVLVQISRFSCLPCPFSISLWSGNSSRSIPSF